MNSQRTVHTLPPTWMPRQVPFPAFCEFLAEWRIDTQDIVALIARDSSFTHHMRCPKCGQLEDKVIDSRASRDGISIRRRRECEVCGYRFTTYEQIERTELRVIKRDGRGEPFDRQKLMSGIIKACEKRPVSLEQLEKAVEEIMIDLEANHGREIRSQTIGSKVMGALHGIDEVAYVRYASVYRQFQDIGEFIDEIQSLEKRERPNQLQPDLFK